MFAKNIYDKWIDRFECFVIKGERFVPGQVVDTEYGPRFVPGKVIEIGDKITFIPAQIVQTDQGSSRFS